MRFRARGSGWTRSDGSGRRLLAAGALLAALLFAGSARAESVAPTPIPQNPSDLAAVPAFIGSPAKASRVSAPTVPQNPFMAPNGRSNLHDDAYMTNTYLWSGPLGNSMERSTARAGS